MKSLLPPFLRSSPLRLGAALLAILFAVFASPAIAADPTMAIAAIALGGVLDVATIAPLNGWKQLGAAHWVGMDQHRFAATSDGQLAHYTGESLRAIVPPEGWADYCKLWPEAKALIDQLTKPAKKKKGDAAATAEPAATGTEAPPAEAAGTGETTSPA